MPPGDKLYPLQKGGAILLRRDAFVSNDEIADVTPVRQESETPPVMASELEQPPDLVGLLKLASYPSPSGAR